MSSIGFWLYLSIVENYLFIIILKIFQVKYLIESFK